MNKHDAVLTIVSMFCSTLFSLAAVSRYTDKITKIVVAFLSAHLTQLNKVLGPQIGKDAGMIEADGIKIAVTSLDAVLSKFVPVQIAEQIKRELGVIADAAENTIEGANSAVLVSSNTSGQAHT